MWPIFIGGALISVVAFAFLGKSKPAPKPDETEDETDDEETEDETSEETEDEETTETATDDGQDNSDPPEPAPKPPKIDTAGVYVNVDAQKAAKRKARIPKVKT